MLGHDSASNAQPKTTLFVGCMDPQTTEKDLLTYFGSFDQYIQTKLLWNHHTNTSKQCALLFCSSVESANEILKIQHRLHERNLRVKYADEEKKGTKVAQLYYLQVSGIPVDTPGEEIEYAFAQFPDYHSFRFIHGTHHKQKWVAKVAFKNPASMKNLLAAQSHIIVAQKLCKIVEFQPKGFSSNNSDTYSTTNSSYDENEQVQRGFTKLDKFTFQGSQFQGPVSAPEMFQSAQSHYPNAVSLQEFPQTTGLSRSTPGNALSKLTPVKLSASSPHEHHGVKGDSISKEKVTRQIFVPELANEEDDDLFKLFAVSASTKKQT